MPVPDRFWRWVGYGVVAFLTLLLSLRLALPTVSGPYAFGDPRDLAWISTFTMTGEPGDSRLLRPEWAVRPVGIELWYVFKATLLRAYLLVADTRPSRTPFVVITTLWFVLSLVAAALAASGFVRRHAPAAGPRDRAALFAAALLATDAVVYVYVFFAPYFVVGQYDVLTIAANFVSLTLLFALLDAPGRPLFAATALWCLAAAFLKETVIGLYLAAAVFLLLEKRDLRNVRLALALAGTAVLTRFLQLLYGNFVTGADEWNSLQPTGGVFTSLLAMATQNLESMLRLNDLVTEEYHHPILFLLPLLLVLTPYFRVGLPARKEAALRLGVLVYLVMALTGSVIAETRSVAEMAAVVLVTAALVRYGRKGPASA